MCRGLVVNGSCACAVVMAEVNEIVAVERGGMCAEAVVVTTRYGERRQLERSVLSRF